MITLKVDLESTQNYGMSIYKGDDSNFYMFNGDGDILYTGKTVEETHVWEFALGTFKLNEDKIITQTQEYFEKYYVCDKTAYEESLKTTTDKSKVFEETDILSNHKYIKYDFNGVEFAVLQKGEDVLFKCGGVEFSPKEVLKDFLNFPWETFASALNQKDEESLKDGTETLFENYNAADDTDIEEEIQRVLVGLKSTDIYTNTYQAFLSTLRLLIDIREKI